jgi:hypothetical protein
MRYLIISCLILWGLTSFSYADFQSEIDVCSRSENSKSCYQKTRSKFIISKDKACKLSDWVYSMPLEVKWNEKNKKVWSYRFQILNKKLYYIIVVYGPNASFSATMLWLPTPETIFWSDINLKNYRYSYDCITKKAIDLNELFVNGYGFDNPWFIFHFNNIIFDNKDLLLWVSLYESMRSYVIGVRSTKSYYDLVYEIKHSNIKWYEKWSKLVETKLQENYGQYWYSWVNNTIIDEINHSICDGKCWSTLKETAWFVWNLIIDNVKDDGIANLSFIVSRVNRKKQWNFSYTKVKTLWMTKINLLTKTIMIE